MNALNLQAGSSTAPMTARLPVPADELLRLMNRALNTMEPVHWPAWVKDMIGGHVEGGQLVEGVLPSDSLTLVIERQRG